MGLIVVLVVTVRRFLLAVLLILHSNTLDFYYETK